MTAAAMLHPNEAPAHAELMRRAAGLVPILRERAARGEKLRRVPDETIADLVDSKILRVCQPRRFGGSELGYDALCEVSIELGRGDGSQAWVANVYSEHAYIAGMFSDEAQHEVWDASLDTLISASIVPQGNKVIEVDGGYRLQGKWSFASGVHHANWLLISEVAETKAGKREHLYCLLPKADVTVDDDWHTVGMVGTGSASVMLDDVFVPGHRVITNADVVAGTCPGSAINTAPLYRMPIMGFAQLALASVPVGVAAGMVEDFIQQVRGRPGQAGAELLSERIAEASAEVRAATLLLVDTARRNMQRLADGIAIGEAEAALSMRDSGYAMSLAKRAAGRLFEATGGRGLKLDAPMQRAFRDVYGGASHGSLSWERSALRFAQYALKG